MNKWWESWLIFHHVISPDSRSSFVDCLWKWKKNLCRDKCKHDLMHRRSSFHATMKPDEKLSAEMLCIMCLIMNVNFVVFEITSPCCVCFLMTIFSFVFVCLQNFHVKNTFRKETDERRKKKVAYTTTQERQLFFLRRN